MTIGARDDTAVFDEPELTMWTLCTNTAKRVRSDASPSEGNDLAHRRRYE
jgi:hypothetical protein